MPPDPPVLVLACFACMYFAHYETVSLQHHKEGCASFQKSRSTPANTQSVS